jgi:hypothetical protein
VMFQRSNSGLSNLYLFHRVDAVVFVEGGIRNLSLAAVEEGHFNEAAYDAKFWALLFRRFLPKFRFQFRPVGSKTTLLELAGLVSHEEVRNVVVCMDRDFDHFLGRLIRHPRIFYTHGYSWENDVWSLGSTTAVFKKLNNRTDCDAALAELRVAFALFSRTMKWPLLAHALLVTNTMLEVTNADLEQAVMRGAGKMPVVNCAHLRQRIKEARPRHPKPRVRFPVSATFSVANDCYGHLLATYAFHTVAYLLRQHCSVRSLGKDVAASIAIDVSYGGIMKDPNKRSHYQQHFSALAAAM